MDETGVGSGESGVATGKGNSATVSSKLLSSIIYLDSPATAFSRLGLREGGDSAVH